MELIDLILGNYDKDGPEYRFTKILKESYKDQFNIDEFDQTYNDVAGYKPIKTSIGRIASSIIDSYELNDDDRDYVFRKFEEAYEDVADKTSLNVQAIIDGIVEEIDFSKNSEDDESDLVLEDDDEDFDFDEVDSEDDE
jgi:hypothetical protein